MAILAILVSCAAAVQCDDYSLLDDLSALDLTQVINRLFGTRVDSLHSEAGSGVSDGEHALRARDYDWDQCVVDVGTIADGLNRTEMWAIQGEENAYFQLSEAARAGMAVNWNEAS